MVNKKDLFESDEEKDDDDLMEDLIILDLIN